MAEHQDITAAQQTFNSFISLLKVGTIASFLVGALVVLLIAPK